MVINSDMKMADLVMLDIQILALIQRLNIPLGFRDKTIREVCTEHDVNETFFIQLANACHDSDYVPKEQQLTFPPECMIRYLQSTHKDFLHYRIPSIEKQIAEIEQLSDSPRNPELLLNFFREYISEFQSHLDLEERTVFPYTLLLSQCIREKTLLPQFSTEFGEYNIDRYMHEHNDIEEKLFDLKNILIKYMPPPTDSRKYNSLIHDLFHLEKDLNDHTDLENKVLAPLVRLMEKELQRII
ncbi:MAG: hemerythrin domain-containing protein [Marinilabiliaceae bacterium]|nr:hemerythrin domain-containing protein [Marinilabiliaceae bacterium]